MNDEDEFQNYCLRIDLLNVDFECYWVVRVPDWLSLSEFHQCFLVILEWPEGTSCDFDFEDGSYRKSRRREQDVRRTYLSDAFRQSESAYYNLHKEEGSWTFKVRRVVVCSDVSSSVMLVHSEELPPPAHCADLAQYVELYNSGDLPRKTPAEEIERRLQRLERNTTNWIGPYKSQGMTLHQAIVASLLERKNRPAAAEELEARLYWSDYEKSINPAAINKAAKRSPIVRNDEDKLQLDKGSADYQKSLQSLARFKDPSDGVKLLAKRFSTHPTGADGENSDIVLVIDNQNARVREVEMCLESDGVEPLVLAVKRARAKLPEAHALVVDQDNLELELAGKLDLPVELRFSLEELVEPFMSLEHPAVVEQACRYPSDLNRAELAAFCEAAQRYVLLAPWSFISEPELFCIEGLQPQPIYAVVLGYAYQIYGLSLFQDFGELLRLLRGERPCSPYCFMDFPNTLDAKNLRQTLDREQIPYLSRDTCPYVYGNRSAAKPEQYSMVTQVLNLISDRISPLSGPTPGTTRVTEAGIVVTWPLDLSYAV
jgi:hypothetical protein